MTDSTHPRDDRIEPQRLRLPPSAHRWKGVAIVIGVVGLGAAAGLGYSSGDGWAGFSRSYLVAWCFWTTISLGGLFYTAVQHAVRAGWSVSTRRLAELYGAAMPLAAVAFLPILLPVLAGSSTLYPWVGESHDELIVHKSVWLNPLWFGVRSVVYLGVWVWLGRWFLVGSVMQDADGEIFRTVRFERLSPIALIILGLTTTFAAFDWIMSLEPKWYSTIFGVYFFAGAAVAILSAVILSAVSLRLLGLLREAITAEHYHDLGKLLFAFTVFWGYIAFSQYLLIWYGNIPEETEYYLHRSHGLWDVWAKLLIFGHLLAPMVGLLSRHVKRQPILLAAWAVWLLAMHWADLTWLIRPSTAESAVWSPWVDFSCMLGLGGVWMSGWLHWASRCALMPAADPRLIESLSFENN